MVIASIVIYKHSYKDLEQTLTSLLCTSVIQKIILVDNDQSDWAKDFNHEKVIYLKTEGNYGFGYGHNFAIKLYAAQSDYFLICNPDIFFDENEFESLINFADTRPESLFLPKIIYENGENQYGARLLPTPLNLFARRFSPKFAEKLDQNYLLKDFDLSKPIFTPYLHGCFMLFKSKPLLILNGFDERFFMYMEDVDLSRRCAEKFGSVYYPLAKVIHLHEQGSYNNKTLLKAHLKSAWQYFNKWGWIYDSQRKKLNEKCLCEING
ncbi:glycosyltransferase [Acinetobacter populi]|uniref:Glycosyl transferase n=1 Tax=Acinetobacter populi TaxID=1582270 RepID=A0A1Z9YWT7_9GAMM|nr:glycosyltransferase [Acinetobacter populi]OUY06684.1 glycosyl transferase [Acinetobacter populi]